jgi:hypothetical protein
MFHIDIGIIAHDKKKRMIIVDIWHYNMLREENW